jgi:hypothetical protein
MNEPTLDCTACEFGCKERFTCSFCGNSYNVCQYRIGGFVSEHNICVSCYSRMNLSNLQPDIIGTLTEGTG